MKRAASLMLVSVLLAVPATLAAAQETTTTVPGSSTSVPEAAVPVSDVAPVAVDDAWTFRFIVPTLIVLGLALVVGLSAAYHLRIKTRYRVVR